MRPSQPSLICLPMLMLLGFTAACAGTAGSPAESGSVSGTVAYRERMTLPPDAEVRVQLSDVSRPDAAATVIAETRVAPEGRQVPLPFELRHDPAKIDPGHSYAVRATIRAGGRLLFTTQVAHHVITRGNPDRVALMLVRVSGTGE